MTPAGDTQTGPLKIMMVAPTSFFADYGCHVRILEETRALQARGHSVTICTYHNGSDLPGIHIRRSLDVPWRKRLVVGSSKHKLYLDGVLSVESLRATLSERPDIIHAHLHEGALIGGVLSRLTRTPLVFDYQGSLSEEMIDHGFLRREGLPLRFVRSLERGIDRLPQTIVTSSINARDRLMQHGFRGRVTTVLDAVDTARFSPDSVTDEEKRALRDHLGIPENARVIVYLGLLAPYQGSDLLLDAAETVVKQSPDAFFLIMGFPGDQIYRVSAVERGLARHTSFPGRIPYLDAHKYLALGDIAVAPKMSLTEGNGKIYNYMAMGLPVVAFDAPANREILGDLGNYARHGSAEELAAQIIALLRNDERRRSQASLSREHAVRHLSWDMRVDEILAVYQGLLAERRHGKSADGRLTTPDVPQVSGTEPSQRSSPPVISGGKRR